MAVLANGCEGGVPPNAVTTGNSGGASGNAWDRVEADSPVTYSSTAAHGSVGILCNGASDAYVGWETGIPGTSPTLWARAYIRLDALPAANTNILRMLSSSNGIMGTIRINTTGTLGMLYGTGMFGGNTTGAVTLGQWARVEFAVAAGGSNNGTMILRIYWTPDATTPSQEITSSNVTTGAVNPTRLRAGILSNSAAVYVDDIALSDEGWIGPVDSGGGPATGTLTAALPALTATVTGTARAAAGLDAQLPALTTNLTGQAVANGTLDTTLPAITAAATARAHAAALLAAALPALSATADGTARTDAALDAVLPPLAASIQAAVETTGALDVELPALTAALQGVAIPEGGRLDITLPALTATATGTAHTDGTLSAALPALDAHTTARALTGGALATPLPALVAAFTGERGAAPSGTLNAALPALTAELGATGTARAALTATLPALTAHLSQDGEPLPALTGAISHKADLSGTLTSTATLTGALTAPERLTGTVRR